MAKWEKNFQKFGSSSTKLGLQETRSQTPPASSILNAFERSFESFLSNKAEQTNGQESAARISENFSENSLVKQRNPTNPSLSYQTQTNNIRKQENFVGFKKVSGQGEGQKLIQSKTLTLSKKKTFNSSLTTVEKKVNAGVAPKPTFVTYQDDEATEAVNNLLNSEAGEISPERLSKNHNLGKKKEHEILHTEDFPFNCESCVKVFRREDALLAHKCLGTSINSSKLKFRGKKVYKCDKCERSYTTKQNFHQHKCSAASVSATNNSKSHININDNEIIPKSNRRKVNMDEDQESVYIDVPVRVTSSEIVFQGDNHYALIMGDIIDLDVEDLTLDEAIIEGYQVETVPDHSNTIIIEDTNVKNVPYSALPALPCAMEMISLSSGIDVDELRKLVEFHAEDEIVEPCTFPWQDATKALIVGSKKDQQSLLEGGENKLLKEENESSANLVNTLEELPSVIRPKSSEMQKNKNCSMNKYIYFNDTSLAYESGDDSDDKDWSEMTEKVKRKSSKYQMKKLSRNQTSTSLSEKRQTQGHKEKTRVSQNSSFLLQEDDDKLDIKTNATR